MGNARPGNNNYPLDDVKLKPRSWTKTLLNPKKYRKFPIVPDSKLF